MNDKNEREYAVLQGEPYLTKDIDGKYVILREETIFSAKKGEGTDQCYITDVLVNPEPSDKEIFVFKLLGAVKRSTFSTGRQVKDS